MCDVTLLAQGGLPPELLSVILVVVIMSVVMFGVIALMLRQYKRCPPNRIMVIYGKAGPDTATKCVHGGARLVVPVVQDVAWLSLEPIRIELSRQVTSSGKTISDPLPRVFSVAIGTTPELMQNAAARLLGLTSDEIKRHAEDILVARLDRLLDAIEAGEVAPGGDQYYGRLESSLEPELSQLGLVLINVRRE